MRSRAGMGLLFAFGLLVSACASRSGTTDAPSDSAPAGQTEAPAPVESVKAAFAYPGPIADQGWNHRHELGRQSLMEELDGQVESIFVENVPYTEELTQLHEQFVADGYTVLVDAGSAGDLFRKVCDVNPDVACITTDARPPLGANIVGLYPKHWEGTYLLGVAAGHLSESGKLGYIAGFFTPPIIANVNALALGCQSVRPDCTVHVTALDSWYDPAKATEQANTLVDVGVDFLYNTADATSAIAVAEERGVWAAGAYDSQIQVGSDAYVSADVWDWGNAYISLVSSVLDGSFEGGRAIYPGLADGGVYLDEWGPNVPQEVKDAVTEVEAALSSGASNPFVGPLNDQDGAEKVAGGEELTDDFMYYGWDWFVEGVISR